MKVLIVAKTRKGTGACVGGINAEGRSVRLIAHDADSNDHAGLEYEVGDVWDVNCAPDPHIIPPHVENVIVHAGRKLRATSRLTESICRFMPPVYGGPEDLYDGLLQVTSSGRLFISEKAGLPAHSTMFWIPDYPLRMDCSGKRIHYVYPSADGDRAFVFVGFQEPVKEIPAGTLLRVSLAHWWRPSDKPNEELRCFAQLSGWFMDETRIDPKSLSSHTGSAPALQTPRVADSAPDASRVLRVLKETFGFSKFMPVQGAIVERLLRGQDTLAVMPTGGGKSLCYQLPALLFEGLTVVVSPLVALMQDQVSQLAQVGINASCLNHLVSYQDYQKQMRAAREGRLKLLYLAPETLSRPEILVLLEQSRTACIAIDEAHCISEWGHDFRPDYRQLAALRNRFPKAVCVALTATATKRVREDIREQLEIPADGEFVASFDRKNLFFEAEKRQDALAQVISFLEPRRGQSGIVYCGTRKQADELCAGLSANGWPALAYHAGMDGEDRRRNQEKFTSLDGVLMVATVAFGMGINKANVRFVIHAHLPKDLESYYQEVGRAGRDGLPAECLLLYANRDASVHRHFIRQGAETEQSGRRERLNAMMDFVETRACRREVLLAYFGETSARRCGNCDNCAPKKVRSQVFVTLPDQAKGEGNRVPAYDPALFERLRQVRKAFAEEKHVPAFVIFSDRTLLEMAEKKPKTSDEFLEVNGVGGVKLATYGEAFLGAIREYEDLRASGYLAPNEAPAMRGRGARRNEIARRYQEGASIQQIATELCIKPKTVVKQLLRFVEAGGKLAPEPLLQYSRLPQEMRGEVLETFKRVGSAFLAPVRRALGGSVDYEELNLLRLYYLSFEKQKSQQENESPHLE